MATIPSVNKSVNVKSAVVNEGRDLGNWTSVLDILLLVCVVHLATLFVTLFNELNDKLFAFKGVSIFNISSFFFPSFSTCTFNSLVLTKTSPKEIWHTLVHKLEPFILDILSIFYFYSFRLLRTFFGICELWFIFLLLLNIRTSKQFFSGQTKTRILFHNDAHHHTTNEGQESRVVSIGILIMRFIR